MPVEVEFALDVERPQWVTYRDVFAVVASWLDQGDPAGIAPGGLSARAPLHSDRKPYTLRMVNARRDVRVRLALLDDRAPGLDEATVGDDLIAGIRSSWEPSPGRGVTLGGQAFRALPVEGDGAGAPYFRVVRYSSWEDLAAVQTAAKWELRFLQPTSFRSDSAYLPFPIAEYILRGTCSVWDAQAPAELRMSCPGGVDCRHARMVRVIDYDISTARGAPVPEGHSAQSNRARVAASPKSAFLGFRGRAVLGLRFDRGDIPESVRQEVSTLLAFSRFAGVGTGTARGYGATDPRPIRGARKPGSWVEDEAAPNTLT